MYSGSKIISSLETRSILIHKGLLIINLYILVLKRTIFILLIRISLRLYTKI